MKDSTAITIFKVIGALQVIGALIMFCLLTVSVIGMVTVGIAEMQMAAIGETSGVEIPMFIIIGGLIITFLSMILNATSAFGFFKLKKWQPTIISILIPLSIIEIILNFVQTGLQPASLISVVFLFIWIGLLALVWQKKALFKN